MTKRLSPRTKAVYAFIEAHIHQHGFAPTYRQIGEAFGISSTSVVREHVHKLVAAGKLCKEPFAARGLALPNERTLPPLEKRVPFLMSLGAVPVGYMRADGTLVKVDLWTKRGTEYVRVGTIE